MIDKIRDIKKRIKQIDGIKFSYLFGSAATNQIGPLSDIDIAVYLEPSADFFDNHLMIHHQLAKGFRKRIDLVILNRMNNLFLLESILSSGIILSDSNDDSRPYYETITHHRILDYKHFKKIIDAA